ncbi:MAG TPA: hypothetical protein VKU00_19535 [Chthonomonadaceae bacterium]|nr:hypothetical protein [Chthonomonadaceae bacterium]
MLYLSLSEILSALDAQQRKELAALSGGVDDAERNRLRNARKQLSTVAVFFIERSWEIIAPSLEAFSLEAEVGKTTGELREHLKRLHRRQPAFAWGWVRARMNARLMLLLEACVPNLLREYPERAALYTKSLRRVDASYWFRETPLHHLKAGYHTALGVACKWYGSTFELLQDRPQCCPLATRRFREELRLFASFSLTMLVRTDSYLWDSAGAKPLDAIWEDGTLKIALKTMEELSLDSAPDYGIRLGCPALRARRQAGEPAFPGILDWVEQVFSRYLQDPLPTPP